MSRKISRDTIVGSWRLLSAVQHFDDGTKAAEFGPNACGYLFYTPEGTVSAVLGASDRPVVAALDPLDATPDEYASSARTFVASPAHTRLTRKQARYGTTSNSPCTRIGKDRASYGRFDWMETP